METTEEPWELFDLEADLQVTLSEDGKEYLRQFGLEQYDFENYQPDDDPGKFFQDVPLEQNPEALFDLLTRESFRNNSNRRSTTSTAPPRQKSAGRRGKSGNREDVSNSGHAQRARKPDTSPTYHSIDIDLEHNGVSSPKTHPKRVSFTENGLSGSAGHTRQANKENKPRDSADAAKHSKSVTNFFGRPKVKHSKKGENKDSSRDSATNFTNGGITAGQHEQETNNDFNQNDGGELRGVKKPRKFKFPVLDLMGKNKKSGVSNNKQTNKPEDTRNKGSDAGAVGRGSSADSQMVSSGQFGVGRVDLLQGSPELDKGVLGVRRDGTTTSSLTDSDSDTYMTHTQMYAPPDPPPRMADSEVSVGDVTIGSGRDLKVVEVVSCHAPEMPTEMNGQGHGKVEGAEHLPPGLLAAVTGDLDLLKESVAHLSPDSLNKLRDAAGNTVLHACAAGGHTTCTEFICRHCPLLVTTENKAHLTPTAMAIKHGQIEVLDWLLDNMNLKHELSPSHTRRRSLLHHAAKFGQDGCLRLLLSKMEAAGLTLDVKDQSGNTAGHIAAKYGHLMCLQSLVEYGLDVCSTNQYGHTACYLADFNNHRHCAGYLVVVETCTTLAKKHVTQAARTNWLQTHNDDISSFTSEALSLCGAIVRQSSDDVDVTYRLQQTLDDAMDLVGDMASQLNHLYELTCHLQEKVYQVDKQENRHLPSPGKDDLRVSMERATDLQRRLEELDAVVNHQTSRQQLLKVKDVQRRWETVLNAPYHEPKDMEQEARQFNRELFSEAVKRLMVYRTTDHTTRQAAPPLEPSNQEAFPSTRDLPMQIPLPSTYPNTPDGLRKLSPRARIEANSYNSPSHSTRKGDIVNYDQPNSREQKMVGLSHNKITDQWGGSLSQELIGSSTDASFSSVDESGSDAVRPQKSAKNNVVESFLKHRVFYQQEQISAPKTVQKDQISNLFYPNQQLSISQTQDSLKFSEFSAFDRVANRPPTDSKPSLGPFQQPLELSKAPLQKPSLAKVTSKHPRDFERLETLGNPNLEKTELKLSQLKTDRLSSCEAKISENKKDSSEISSVDSDFKQNNEGANRNDAIHKQVSKIQNPENSSQQRLAIDERRVIAPGIYIDSEESEEPISEPTIPPPPLPPLPPPPSTSQTRLPSKPPVPQKPHHLGVMSQAQSVTSSSDGSIPAGEERQEGSDSYSEEDLSGVDLGAELDDNDLMLGHRVFLDDEIDGDMEEQLVDDMFSPEELLALHAPRGPLPLSMQFETSLSTIEEVSVVSESTRADDNTDAESRDDNGMESDDTVTQPSDHEDVADHIVAGNIELTRHLASSSPVASTNPGTDGEKPWYETSDDDESSPAHVKLPLSRLPERPEHFTLF